MNCPNCGKELTIIYGTDKYTLTSNPDTGTWEKEEDPSRLVCGNCYEDLDNSDIADILEDVGLL